MLPIDDWPEPKSRELLAEARGHAIRNHLQALVALQTAADALGSAGIPWLVFKGPVLSEVMYTRPDQRTYVDLDLLVPPRGFGDALSALERAGGSVLDRNWSLVLDRMKAEVRLLLGPMVVDLHWHLINQRGMRKRFTVDSDQALARARSIRLADATVRTLGRVDTLVHTALHAALAGADRLVWLKDVCRCIRTDEPDWDLVVEVARSWRVELPVAATLWRARRIVGAPVPVPALEALGPTAWRALLRGIQRLAPLERTMPGRSVSGLVASAARESGPMTAISLVRRSLEAAARGSYRSAIDHAESSPLSPLHPSGGQAARSMYLRAVSDGATPIGDR
jgi:hypothetical protein